MGLVAVEVDFLEEVLLALGKLFKDLEDNRNKIEGAIAQIESKTIGELVPVIIKTSDLYLAANLRFGLITSLLTPLLIYYVFPNLVTLDYIFLSIPGFILGYFIANFPIIKRKLILSRESNEEVHQMAIQYFHHLDLKATQGRSAILILVSLLEKRVVILADSGIHKKLPDGNWDQFLIPLLSHIKNYQLSQGLCETILGIGKILELHFPSKGENLNEIPNRLIIDV